jgi:hypothetical protein
VTEPTTSQCRALLAEVLAADANAHPEDAALKVRSLLQCFTRLPAAEQDEIRALLQPPEARMVASFSVAAAEQALAERDERWLEWSLLAHDVEQFRDDPRNNLILLAVTDYAAQQLGVDPKALFERVAAISSPRTGTYLREFAARPKALRSLKTMRVRAETEDGRVKFRFD